MLTLLLYINRMGKKITIIGAAGRSGSDTISELFNNKILSYGDELVMVDINNRAKGLVGEVKTLSENSEIRVKITPVSATKRNELDNIANSDVIVMCTGTAFPKGGFKSRDWALYRNDNINSFYAKLIGEISPNSKVVIDTNPLDNMTTQFCIDSKMSANFIIGKGGDLDTQRLRSFLSRAITKKIHMSDLDIKFHELEDQIFKETAKYPNDICMVGEHSAENMVAVINTEIKLLDKPIKEFLSYSELSEIIHEAKNVGPKSSELLEIGSPSKGSARINAILVKKLLSNESSLAYISTDMKGKYGIEESIFSCSLCRISSKGVEDVIELDQIKNNISIKEDFMRGISSTKRKMDKIKKYREIREVMGETPAFEALIKQDGKFIISYENDRAENTEKLMHFLMGFKELAPFSENMNLIKTSRNYAIFEHPEPKEIKAFLDDLGITSYFDIEKQLKEIQEQSKDLKAKFNKFMKLSAPKTAIDNAEIIEKTKGTMVKT